MTRTNDEIYEMVETVNGNVNDLVAWQSKMNERCENHRKDTDVLTVTMFGKNGGPGIKDRVNTMTNVGIFMKAILIIAAGGCMVAVVVWMMTIYKGS